MGGLCTLILTRPRLFVWGKRAANMLSSSYTSEEKATIRALYAAEREAIRGVEAISELGRIRTTYAVERAPIMAETSKRSHKVPILNAYRKEGAAAAEKGQKYD